MITTEFDEAELLEVLQAHSLRYPASRPQDAVKLIYQNEFGGGHLLTNRDRAMRMLEQEWKTANAEATTHGTESEPFAEDIGGGFLRLNLRPAAHAGFTAEQIGRMFAESAMEIRGNKPRFLAKLDFLKAHLAETNYFFDADELSAYTDEYVAGGCLPMHHSDKYKELYRPAYRIVEASKLC